MIASSDTSKQAQRHPMDIIAIFNPTMEFIWKNGTLMQKVGITREGVDTEPQEQWLAVKVGGQKIKQPGFQTFEQRNGRAPEPKREGWDHVIEFDGGTSCNDPKKGYGDGYGSYQIDGGEIKRVKFGKGHSGNSAEIRTLIAALHELAQSDRGGRVLCRGDSQIALKWITCRTAPKSKCSPAFISAVIDLHEWASKFTTIKGEWRRRNHSVKLFGH